MPIDNQNLFCHVTSQNLFDRLPHDLVLMIVEDLEDIHDLVNLTGAFPDLRARPLYGSTKVPVKSGVLKEQVADNLCRTLNLPPCFLLAWFSTSIHDWAHAEDNNETTLAEVQSAGPERVTKTRKAVLYRELIAGEMSLLGLALDSLSIKMSLDDLDDILGQYYFFSFLATKMPHTDTVGQGLMQATNNFAENHDWENNEYASAMARFVYFNGIMHRNGKKLLIGASLHGHHSTSLLDPAIQAALVQFCMLPINTENSMERQVASLALDQLCKFLAGELTAERNGEVSQAFRDSTDYATRPKARQEAFRRKMAQGMNLLCFGAGIASLKLAEKGWDKTLVLGNQEIRDLLIIIVNTDKKLSYKITRFLSVAPWTMKIEPWDYFQDLGPPQEMVSEYSVALAYLKDAQEAAKAQKSNEGHTDQGQGQ